MQNKNTMFTFRLPLKMLNDYKEMCEENSINMSKRLRKYIEKDMEFWQKNKN